VRRGSRARLRVEQYSADIAQRVRSVLADYAKNSQESDRTFPERLVNFVRSNQTALPARSILDQMNRLETKRQRLVSLGFLDSESGLRDLTEDDVRRAGEALTIYVGDVNEKLKVFDDLAQRAGTLIDVLNARFQYKRITIRRDLGFRVTAENDEHIDLADLSSGEQHELVVLYELLFRAPRRGLVLVDEPEISLHVAWQSRFLQDLNDVLALTDSYAIVATHSPVVIGTRWDLAVELRGPNATD
jgi:AAA domain, putative AbiEii toxin, Type IV TA system